MMARKNNAKLTPLTMGQTLYDSAGNDLIQSFGSNDIEWRLAA